MWTWLETLGSTQLPNIAYQGQMSSLVSQTKAAVVPLTADFDIVVGMKCTCKIHMLQVSTQFVRGVRSNEEESGTIPVIAGVTPHPLSQRVKNQRDCIRANRRNTQILSAQTQGMVARENSESTQRNPDAHPPCCKTPPSWGRQRLCPPHLSHVMNCPTVCCLFERVPQ